MTRALILFALTLTGCGTLARIPRFVICTTPLCSTAQKAALWGCVDLGRCAVKDYPRKP